MSLRVPRRQVFSLPELVDSGALPPDGAALLGRLVASRVAFLVTGGTGTGKTTLLSALLTLVDTRDRLLLVEDAGELAPAHPHVVRLEARPPNLEGAGAVTLRDLVRQALRMRPDRLVVGEVRGAEVVDLLAALNTGHEGGCGTLHANSARDVPARLEALAAAAGLGREALHSQLASGLRLVVHLVRAPGGGRRRVAEVSVLTRAQSGLVAATPAWTWCGQAERGEAGPAADELEQLVGHSLPDDPPQLAGHPLPDDPEQLVRHRAPRELAQPSADDTHPGRGASPLGALRGRHGGPEGVPPRGSSVLGP